MIKRWFYIRLIFIIDYGKIIKIIDTKLSIIYLYTCSYNILQTLHQTSQPINCKFLSYLSQYKNQILSYITQCIVVVMVIWKGFFLSSPNLTGQI